MSTALRNNSKIDKKHVTSANSTTAAAAPPSLTLLKTLARQWAPLLCVLVTALLASGAYQESKIALRHCERDESPKAAILGMQTLLFAVIVASMSTAGVICHAAVRYVERAKQ